MNSLGGLVCVFDRPGAYRVQLLIDIKGGPRPALETDVFADLEPSAAWNQTRSWPCESLDAVLDRVNDLRRQAGLRPLVRNLGLDRIAAAHAERMRASRQVAHDAGDGVPAARLARAGLGFRKGAENVAMAVDLAQAQESLEQSPSHLAAMLGAFDSVGLGMALDEEHRVYLTEFFAAAQSR
jgi:uncharacterized protein YkwD